MTNDIYYVYAFLRTKDSDSGKAGSPYYIGKGKENRAFQVSGRIIQRPADKNNIVFLETHLTEVGAFALERRYISWYGRIDNSTGILRNQTDGGDGASGRIERKESKDARIAALKDAWKSEELKIQSSARSKKYWASDDYRTNRLSELQSEDRRAQQSNRAKEYWQSDEYRIKYRKSRQGIPLSPDSIAKRTATRTINAEIKRKAKILDNTESFL